LILADLSKCNSAWAKPVWLLNSSLGGSFAPCILRVQLLLRGLPPCGLLSCLLSSSHWFPLWIDALYCETSACFPGCNVPFRLIKKEHHGPISSLVAKSMKQKDNIGIKQPTQQPNNNQPCDGMMEVLMEVFSKAGFTNLATVQLNIMNT
jgi:hypothetical protein